MRGAGRSGKSSRPPLPQHVPVSGGPRAAAGLGATAAERGFEARGLCLCWLPLSKRLILEQSRGRGSLVPPPLNSAGAPGQGAEVRGAHAPRRFWMRPLQKRSPGAEQPLFSLSKKL